MMRNAPDTWWHSCALAERLYISERGAGRSWMRSRDEDNCSGRQEDIGWQFRHSPSTGDLRDSSIDSCITTQSISW